MQSRHFIRAATAALVAAFIVLGLPVAHAAPSCGGRRATKVGTKGNDTIRGTNDDDLEGGSGDDRIVGATERYFKVIGEGDNKRKFIEHNSLQGGNGAD